MSKTVVTVGMVLIMLAAPLAGVAGAASAQGTMSQQSSGGEFSIDENSPFTLQADYDSTDAATVVENQDILLDIVGTPDSLEREYVGVFNSGGTVPLVFDEELSNHDEDDDLEVVVGTLDPNQSSLEGGNLMGLLDDPNESLNDNVDFTESLDLNGDNVAHYDDADTGQYVALVVGTADGDDLKLEDGDIHPPASDATIHGVDSFAVQDQPSDVTDSGTVEPGNDADFTADTDITGDVHHAIVLYDSETFSDQETTIGVEGTDIDDIDSDDIEISTTIEEVNGVAILEDDFEILGTSVSADQVDGSVSLEAIFSLVAAEHSDLEDVDFDADGVTLDASATGLVGGSEETITVETLGDWDDGDYQWIHFATNDAGEFETSEGTITLETDTGTAPSPSPSPSPPSDDDDDDPDEKDDDPDEKDDDDDPDEKDDDPDKTDDDPATDDDAPTDDEPTDDGEPVADDDEPVTDDDEPTEDDDTIPGFGVTAALVAFLSVVVFGIRRLD
ncbi:PGF-CTERM sorting domain-containing protein [Natrarchaeobius chitinivorans]|uniref:PGF-CTERM sorting domain-containing protein n=1 Tax=Natrarchaeobius chitinivorans TaxID=1679083 RepID=A0A3N6M2J1_NATCH|nr:PGF-CTERM sorting domain-containing protein [Natrarchaeobius chitinivorans]RQG96017.1 PGF-CTERM sorting domain-containing protein [Natrarchaeobius chitinivorans]